MLENAQALIKKHNRVIIKNESGKYTEFVYVRVLVEDCYKVYIKKLRQKMLAQFDLI